MRLSIYHTHTHSLGHMSEREVVGTRERERLLLSGDHLIVFGVFLLVLILSPRRLWGFLLYGFPKEKICVHYLLCLNVVLVILLVKDPNIMLA